jgi:2'-hydroxyisoflavone reductase
VDLLVLGGTAWLSREVAREAVARGHSVTCLARGEAGPVADGARSVIADRDRPDAYHGVSGDRWDAVVDVARHPGHVRRAVAALEPVAARYLFVSSASVYAAQREPGEDEDAALLPPLASDVMESMESYGEAKVACEQAVLEGFGAARSVVARAGLIGGPGDWSGRSGYWPWRFANPSNPDRAVLVPDDPRVPTALIDVRDLAAWVVGGAEAGMSGVFNAAGEPRQLEDHLAVARSVAGHTGPLVPASPGWLTEHGVQSWMGPRSLPMWLDDADWYGMNARSTGRARAAGLVTRPLEDTLADTLAWERARPEPGPHGAGLTDEEERHLLALLSEGGAGR